VAFKIVYGQEVSTILLSEFEKERHFMKLTYDPRYNIGYIRFKDKHAEVQSIKLSDELIVDIAPDGTVYGIELLNANEQLQRENVEGLIVVNEATGEQTQLPLTKTN